MTATPFDPQSAGRNRDSAAEKHPIALTFEDKLELLWRRHSTLVVVACLAVALAIIGTGIWERVEASQEKDVESAYAAATTPETLKAFADAHPEHALGGAAYLRLADDAFAANKTSDALANYEKALRVFKSGPFAARAHLGIAVAKVVGGQPSEGAVELKQLVDDTGQFKGVRAEAAYHLASLAAEARNSADVQKYSDLLMQIDASSPWTQRALALRASLPVSPTPAAATEPGKAAPAAAPAIQFTPAAK